MHTGPAVEGEPAAGNLKLQPRRMIGRAQHTVGGEAFRNRQQHRANDVQSAVAVERQTLQIVNARLARAGHSQNKPTAAVGGESAISSRRHRHPANVAVERQVAECRGVANGLVRTVDDDIARADRRRRRGHRR